MIEQLYNKLGLTDFEYFEIIKRLRREPNETEIYLFSAMWSEHCGYKHSKKYLNEFPRNNAVCHEENSGGVEIGKHIIFFKTESHNHPSAVEPFQGAATGVGGIVRDILTIGARPVLLMDSLKFGPLSEGRNKYLLDGVVNGISTYGNSIGVPTIGGETSFDECYSSSPIVNVLCAGMVEKSKIIKSSAAPNGIVILLGSYTGRDGIHGASFASKELEAGKKEDKLSVQIADPFMKKNVIEATLEILALDGIIAAQDCGAAGLLSSTSEMAYKGKCSMELYLDKVHLREKNMKPWEIMLSESQERMVFIVKENCVEKIFDIAKKYDIPISVIGKTLIGNEYKLYYYGKEVANLTSEILNDCITYELKYEIPQKQYIYLSERNLEKEDIIKILKSPDVASKKYIYSQYDYMVGNRTVSKPEKTSVNAIWIQEENCFLGFTMDSNPQMCYLNPFEGARNVVYEAYRNLIASGFKPKGLTDCLNFANPENPQIAYEFIQSIKGISQACKELDIPVVSGNVSFYNENIYPTANIGMVGISKENVIKNTITEGDYIYLIGKEVENTNVGASLYQKIFYNYLGGKIDTVNVELEKMLADFILNNREKLSACNDVSKGGIFVSLFELLHTSYMGFKGDIGNTHKKLFGEITGRYIIASHENIDNIISVPYKFLGRTQKNTLDFNGFSFNIKELFKIYDSAFEMELKG